MAWREGYQNRLAEIQTAVIKLPSVEDLIKYEPKSEWSLKSDRFQQWKQHNDAHLARQLIFVEYLLRLAKKRGRTFNAEDEEAMRWAAVTCDQFRTKDVGEDSGHGENAANPEWLETILPNVPEQVRNKVRYLNYLHDKHDIHGTRILNSDIVGEPVSEDALTVFQDALSLEFFVRFPFDLAWHIPRYRRQYTIQNDFSLQLKPLAHALHHHTRNIMRFVPTLLKAQNMGLLR